MTIQDYLNWRDQKRASKNLSLICLKQKHKDISKEVSKMLEARR